MNKDMETSLYNDVYLNEYGFYTLKNLPKDKEREDYYKNSYYQDNMSIYLTKYTEQELYYKKIKLEQKLLLINEHHPPPQGNSSKNRSYLDVGCGEGFDLAFFKEKGFSVLGLDYSNAGIFNHNKNVLDDVLIGDIYSSINYLIKKKSSFDIINLDSVLEHVVDPRILLEKLCNIININGIIIVTVPNDFSILQQYLFNNKVIKKPHWVAPLDHISYFNKEGLINLCNCTGLSCIDFLGNHLIEFYAFHQKTNYFEDKSVGKECYFAIIEQEKILNQISPQQTLEFYRILGKMGVGRVIMGLFKKTL